MSTLLLRFAAPLQSWGVSSKFKNRMTAREPTKSGIVGLVAAALGLRRTDEISDLAALNIGVRADQPGELLRDYHTAHTKDDKGKDKDAFLSDRYYLADAVFLVGLEGGDAFLRDIERALKSPVFPLFLGRRACPPAGQLVLGLRDLPLSDALKNEPWLALDWYQKRGKRGDKLSIVMDGAKKDGAIFATTDTPISFDPRHRRYAPRGIVRISVPMNKPKVEPTEHDPFAGMEGA